MRKKHGYFVDLFAGCGGMSLGLENAGFQPIYVNELNRDALESYLRNRDDKYPYLRKKYHSKDIAEIAGNDKSIQNLLRELENDFQMKSGDIDLVVGGPPCQGYSGIGHRRTYAVDKKDMPSNHLYKQMAYFITKVKPKCFVFENVGGLLNSRWTAAGERGEIWNDVESTFKTIKGYTVRWQLLHAKSYGVPQNRPRVILVGISKQTGFKEDPKGLAGGLLPQPTNDYPDPVDLLGDLVDPDYLSKKSTDRYLTNPLNEVQKKLRTRRAGSEYFKKGDRLTEQEYSAHSERIRGKFEYMLAHDGEIPDELRTKKFAQRVIPERWDERGPNITATSLPEDYVHFSQPRTLTVREWARLQMFPDWYCFAGSRTTGGLRRAGNPKAGIWDREVPKYTQIGNAVPVKLAEEIGKHLMKILS